MLVAFLILPYGCERDEEIDISTKAKFNAPSITRAKHHVEQHTTLNLKDPNYFFQSRDLEGSLTVDWELSGIKEYKDEPEQQVDILYTPIYINNDTQAKMFVGSVEYNGEIKSNIFCLIYTDLENTTTFSGYFLRFDLDGILLSASKYNNGMIVQPENDNSGTLGRSNNSDCTDFNTLLQCLQDYFGGDLDMSFWHLGGILDTVVVTATSIDAGDSSSGGSPLDSAIVTSINIPALETNSNNPAGLSVPYWYTQSVTANGFNISLWLEIHPLTPIAQWLMTEATTNQLQLIANFLNAHKFKIRDEYPLLNVDGSDGFEPADSPTASTGYAIRRDAVENLLDFTEILLTNPRNNELGEIDTSAFNSLLNFTSERDWKATLRQAIANGVTSTAEVTHQIYKKLSEIAQEHPSSIGYLNAIVNEFRDIASETFDSNPQTLDWLDLFAIWLFELGDFPNQFDPVNGTDTIYFDGDDTTTESLKQQEGVSLARQDAIDKISNNNITEPINRSWTYGQVEFYDGMANGNIATSFLGSYNTRVNITQNPNNTHTLTFTVSNPSTWESATRLRIDNDNDGNHDGIFPNTNRNDPTTINLGGTINQTWIWTEIVD